jgi:diguanylate cyclase (GGDEF)-like protein/PAS domain S-box-containing protein
MAAIEPIPPLSNKRTREIEALRSRLAETENKLSEAQELIHAIRKGDVDAVVVSGPEGDQVFTLKDAEYAYRALVESMNEGAATLGGDGTVLYCNRQLSNLLGVPLEQIIGRPMADLFRSETAEIFEALLVRARSGESVTTGLDLEMAEGKSISVQVSLREMASAEPIAFSLVLTDVTERKAQEEIIAAGKLAKSILESTAEAIAVCDESGTVIAGNEALEDLCGCNPLFQPFDSVLTLEVTDETAERPQHFSISNALSGYRLTGLEVLLHGKSGRDVSLLLCVSPLRGPDSTAGCVVTMSDITERKQMEEALRESEETLRKSQRIARLGTFVLDLRTGIWARSDVLEEIFGIDKSYAHTLAGWMALIHPDDRKMITDHLAVEVILNGQPFSKQYRIIRRVDQAIRWIDGQHKLEIDAHGKTAILRGTTRDITERTEAEDKLRLAASVFSHASEGIMIAAPDSTILDVNDAFTQITGYTRDEVLGRNPRILSSGRQNADFYAELWRTLTEQGLWSGEIWNRSKNGDQYSTMQTITAVRDGKGNVRQYVSLFHDNTLLKEQEERLKRIAFYDVLTGLPNRALLTDRLRQAVSQARRREHALAVALLDLDGFKSVNDCHGHDAGDQLLSALANRMKSALRAGDTLARMGGDEFVALLPDLGDVSTSEPVLRRLLDAASGEVQIGEAIIRVSASMGVTFYPQPEDPDPDQLLRQADQAMYQAKLAGRNRFHFFDSAHDQSSSTRYESLNRIRQGMAANEFVLYYQPKVNMHTGQIVGAEALIRWKHPARGLLLPATFLPVIEDHPLAVDIGEWVIDSALAQMESWQSVGFEIPVSVNLGALQLQQDSFVDHLRALLAAHPRIKPFSLELEVLETSAFQDTATVSAVFDACRKIGVLFALDDFGTGYSSLAYLKHLPANVLKIDQSFVREIVNDPRNLAILEALLGLAIAFHLEVIAEGVETVEHGVLLLQLGCELGQGYGIAHPMQASDLPGWSAAWRPDQRWANVLPAARA